MGIGKILSAKGDKIDFELETGKETYNLVPLSNEQFIEVQEMVSDAKQDPKAETRSAMGAMIRLAVHSLNNGIADISKKFTDEMIKKSSTSILMELFEKVIKINKLEKMFDFQQKSQVSGHPTLQSPSAPGSKINTLAELNNTPRVRVG